MPRQLGGGFERDLVERRAAPPLDGQHGMLSRPAAEKFHLQPGLRRAEADELPVLRAPEALGPREKPHGLDKIGLALPVVPVDDVGAVRKLQLERGDIAEIADPDAVDLHLLHNLDFGISGGYDVAGEDLFAPHGAYFPVDRHLPGGDELLGLPAGFGRAGKFKQRVQLDKGGPDRDLHSRFTLPPVIPT